MSFLLARKHLVVAFSVVLCSVIVAISLGGRIKAEVESSAFFAPVISATNADSLVTDVDGDGRVDPGDTVQYTVTISNTGPDPATGVRFQDTLDSNLTLFGAVTASPIAAPDAYTASGNIPIAPTGPAGNVLNNDIDPITGNNGGLTVMQVQGSGANVGVATNTTATGIGGVTGSVTLLANGTFTYQPPPGFAGADTFTYGTGSPASTGTVTINISNMVWFIDNTSVAVNSRGTFTEPFKTITEFSVANFDGIAPNPQNGHHIVLRGTTYNEANGINLRNSQTLTGGAVAFSTVFTADANSVAAYAAFATSTPGAATINTTGAVFGVGLASGNALRGFNVGNTPGAFSISGGVVGNLTVATVNKTGTGGAISVSGSGAFGSTVNFGTLESTSSPGPNINLVGVTGTLGVTSGGTGLSGIAVGAFAVNISGGTVSLNYPGNMSKTTSTGGLVQVSSHATGILTFPAGFTLSDSGGGLWGGLQRRGWDVQL